MSAVRIIKNKAHLLLAVAANVYNFNPSREMKVIGVTGTDGKTTTSNLIYHILKEAGYKVAIISTLGAVINDTKYETGFHVTTPSPFLIQRYLKLAKAKGCTHAVIEVTSHALDQNRVHGINFDIGVLTNITHEHLDYHKSYKKYVEAKLKLLKSARISIVNSNGEWFEYVLRDIPSNKLVTYSLHGSYEKDLSLLNVPFEIKTSLVGDFNLENILAAIACAASLDVQAADIKRAIEHFKAPLGRQEVLSRSPLVVVDFAHTPNSFEKILPTYRKKTTGKLIHVFGSAGKRDKSKRPEMGKVAGYYDDIIILTCEDSRGESVSAINDDIKKGIKDGEKVFEIEDRADAIRHAITIAAKNDTVLITGKGHERSMNLGKGEIRWSDQDVVKKALKNAV